MIWVGTSGYDYPEWRGSFYPSDLPAAKMLSFYAARFSSVEINATFYRMPTRKVLEGWAGATPASFKLTLKVPRRITHAPRLVGREPLVRALCEAAESLGSKRGALLFQLPPSLSKNVDLLDTLLSWLPNDTRAAFEFRNESWQNEEVYECLRSRNAALCITDSETMSTPIVQTANFGYLRLRDERYTSRDLERWADIIQAARSCWLETFVYFKHEEEGKGPAFAKELIDRLELNSQGEKPGVV
jgi:uncharacterized protein YecE (DUF72 family)